MGTKSTVYSKMKMSDEVSHQAQIKQKNEKKLVKVKKSAAKNTANGNKLT